MWVNLAEDLGSVLIDRPTILVSKSHLWQCGLCMEGQRIRYGKNEYRQTDRQTDECTHTDILTLCIWSGRNSNTVDYKRGNRHERRSLALSWPCTVQQVSSYIKLSLMLLWACCDQSVTPTSHIVPPNQMSEIDDVPGKCTISEDTGVSETEKQCNLSHRSNQISVKKAIDIFHDYTWNLSV